MTNHISSTPHEQGFAKRKLFKALAQKNQGLTNLRVRPYAQICKALHTNLQGLGFFAPRPYKSHSDNKSLFSRSDCHFVNHANILLQQEFLYINTNLLII